jgi:hypothetical protein
MTLQFFDNIADETHERKLATKRETAKGICRGNFPAKTARLAKKKFSNFVFLRDPQVTSAHAD